MKSLFPQPLFHGMKSAVSPAGFILFVTFFAFGSLVNATGLPLSFGVGLTIFIFAVPGQIILVDEMARGAAPIAVFISVMLTAIRLLPLTVSMLPILRTKDTPKPLLFLIAHFIAVTVWVQSMICLPPLPKEQRAYHCLGLCLALLLFTTIGTIGGFYASHLLPPPLSATTLMVTPIYFFLSLIEGSKTKSDKAAFFMGTVLAVPLVYYWPEMALMGAGIVGGTIGYFATKMGQGS